MKFTLEEALGEHLKQMNRHPCSPRAAGTERDPVRGDEAAESLIQDADHWGGLGNLGAKGDMAKARVNCRH